MHKLNLVKFLTCLLSSMLFFATYLVHYFVPSPGLEWASNATDI